MMTFEILTIIVIVNAFMTLALYQEAARRRVKLKRKFRNQLWRSKPIIPKHEPPPPLEGYGVREPDLQFFSDFEDFADVVNFSLADPETHPLGPWRLQELPKTELLQLWRGDGPTYGRTYAVFHNQARVGEIEIRPHWRYSTQEPRVTIHIELDWVRLLYFEIVRRFLTDIAMHITQYHPGTLEYLQANQQIDLAMTRVLWGTQEIPQHGLEPGAGELCYGELQVELDGLANYYLEQREYVRNQAAKAGQQKVSKA
jgi:hypothetical protein